VSQFTRPASWLRQLFTPSQTSQPNPGQLSNDVSLVQPYDGGGYPLGGLDGIVLITSTVAAALTTTLFTNNSNTIARVLALTAQSIAGTAPVCNFRVFNPTTACVITESLLLTANFRSFPTTCPIIMPGHGLSGRYISGNASTQVQYTFHVCFAPVGSVFYL